MDYPAVAFNMLAVTMATWVLLLIPAPISHAYQGVTVPSQAMLHPSKPIELNGLSWVQNGSLFKAV